MVAGLADGLKTPVVDGGNLRRVIERSCASHLERLLPPITPKRVLIGPASPRFGVRFHRRWL